VSIGAAPSNAAPGASGLLLRQEGPVQHLTLNRPEVRNAMSLTLVHALRQALQSAETDGLTRVVVLRGAGGHFCAGADLKDMAQARARLAQDPQALAKTNTLFGELCAAFSRTPLATVAVLEGSVMGGGFGLACVADVVLAGDDVAFRLPEASLGLLPAQIAPFLVERLGVSEARRLAITAARLNAAQALALRLAHEVHLSTALDAALARVLAELLQCAPGAVAATKALMAKARLQAPVSLIEEAAQAFSAAALGPEGTEGTLAFLQKRRAAWMPADSR
jgi:isohexenylglutaconyl-CoA hydratase